MGTIATIIAGLVLAGGATVGVVASQQDAPAGQQVGSTLQVDPNTGAPLYDTGK